MSDVSVDHPPATTNVARSLQAEGHRILEVTQLDGTDWLIVVRKA